MLNALLAKKAAPARTPLQAIDPALVTAQDFWGVGNLSPLDAIVGATAIAKLVPKKKLIMGFIGCHLGQRLHRYSEDMDISIDAYETEPAISRFHWKKSSKVRLKIWSSVDGLLKKNRYSSMIAAQASDICPSVGSVYWQCAEGLKSGGKCFAADLMLAPAGGELATPFNANMRSVQEHKDALGAAGFQILEETDLTGALLAGVLSGFRESLTALSELQTLDAPEKTRRCAAYGQQIETWGMLYALAQKQAVRFIGLLAVKP
jgi:hypothetical protein